jgi:hypothetical protein
MDNTIKDFIIVLYIICGDAVEQYVFATSLSQAEMLWK